MMVSLAMQVGVIHPSSHLKIFVIPTSPLSNDLGKLFLSLKGVIFIAFVLVYNAGITNDNYPCYLHGLFAIKGGFGYQE